MSEPKAVERVPDWQERFQKVIDARAEELSRIREKDVSASLIPKSALEKLKS